MDTCEVYQATDNLLGRPGSAEGNGSRADLEIMAVNGSSIHMLVFFLTLQGGIPYSMYLSMAWGVGRVSDWKYRWEMMLIAYVLLIRGCLGCPEKELARSCRLEWARPRGLARSRTSCLPL
jgi:hypothetical protein